MADSAAEVKRISRLIDALFVFAKASPQEAAERLGVTVGTLRRILNGDIDLKLRHILDLLEVLNVRPITFFRVAYESDARAKNTDDVEKLLLGASRIQQAEAFTRQELMEIVEETVLRMGSADPASPKEGAKAKKPPDDDEDKDDDKS